jgi:hypothetical protein
MAMTPIRAAAAAPPAMVRPFALLVFVGVALDPEPETCASWYPKPVVVYATPLEVVVKTLVAVTVAEQPVQEVHGADVLHVPLVQPGQVEAGQLPLSHQEVQGPAVQEPPEVHGPELPQPPGPPPNGPPAFGPHPPPPTPKPKAPVNWVAQLPVGVPVPHGPEEMP